MNTCCCHVYTNKIVMIKNLFNLKPLLPIRHPNKDFFIPEIFDCLPVKNDRASMEHPFFALSTKKDIRITEYANNDVSIKLVPSSYGLPTMMDKDILLYLGSLIVAEVNKGVIPPKTVRFSCRDLMVTTNRHINNFGYINLKNAFERLAGCLITTNIKTGKMKQSSGFHILESYCIVKSSRCKKRMVQVEVKVSDWFYNSMVGKEVLTINTDYFRLRKPLERRLYELARKHCGKQKEAFFSLEKLKDRCGSRSTLKKFRYQIRNIISDNDVSDHFPDYKISLSKDDVVTFSSRTVSEKKIDITSMKPISLRATNYAKEIVSNSGLDFESLREQFSEWIITKTNNPKNSDAAFIGFIKKKIKQMKVD